MKKVFFASAAILLAVISTQAQTSDDVTKNDSKLSKEERKEIKKEKKEERITLRKQEGNDDASYQSKEEFYRDFGDQPDAKWTKTKSYDEVVFNKDGVATTAYYDFDAKLVGTTNFKTFADLPAAGQKQIIKDYKDYTVQSVVFFDDNENNETDMVLYGSQFDDEDNYFVELQKDNKKIVVQVTMDGLVGYFKEL